MDIQAGEMVRFTDEAIAAYLKKGDDVSGVYRVVASTETHVTLTLSDGVVIPGVTLESVSVRRGLVVRA